MLVSRLLPVSPYRLEKVLGWLKQAAKRKGVPCRLKTAEALTTGAATIQTTKGGVPTAVLSIPTGNSRTTAGITRMSDVNHAIKLLAETIRKPSLARVQVL